MAVSLAYNILWLGIITLIVFAVKKIPIDRHSGIIKELMGGILVGNLFLLNIWLFEPMKQSIFLAILSEIAISFFLFRIGFAATIGQIRRIGGKALLVALVGVVATFILGLYTIPYIIPGLSEIQYIFIAAALTTTSVGITARVLKDAGKLLTSPAQIVLSAAIIDDIISLLILALITARTQLPLPQLGLNVGILNIILFIIGATVIGQVLAPILPSLFYRIYPHISAKVASSLLFFIVFFVGSKLVGLSPIVGAFLGGLVLERGYFNKPDEHLFHGQQMEALLEKTSNAIVPIFFVMTGVHMDLSALYSFSTLFIALGLFIIALLGKLACGLVVSQRDNPWLIALGMVPRGEVGLVFANIGLATGILYPQLFSAIIIVIMATTLLAPLMLNRLLPSQAQLKTL